MTLSQTNSVSRQQKRESRATVSVHAHQRGIELEFIPQSHRHRHEKLRIKDGYDPLIRVVPAWKFQGSAVLIMTFKVGAEDQELNVYDIRKRPILLQHLEADGIDINEYGGETDGNGDVRLFDGLPLAFRCFDWSSARPGFLQHACRSLPPGAPAK